MKYIKNYLIEKLSINPNYTDEPEFNGYTLSRIAELIWDLFDRDDFAASPYGGHCTGFEAIRDNGLGDVIEYHCMTDDIEGIILDDNKADADAFWDFFYDNVEELTELILQYE